MPRHEFTVVGNGPFPLDMLRYDSCWPKTQADVQVVYYSHHEGRHTLDRRAVTLSGGQRPTEARWASFGYKVEATAVIA